MQAAVTLTVQEQFVSVQGEGVLVGTPSSFIRVAGCNLRCTWCDSPRTSWEPHGNPTELADLLEFCAAGPRQVVLPGGEPLLVAAVATLATRLRAAGHHVTVETAGTVWLEGLQCDLASISPKLAHSTPHQRDPKWALRHEARRRAPQVVRRLMTTQPWQLKFVVRAADPAELAVDLDEVDAWVEELSVPPEQRHRVLLMPECIDPQRLPLDYQAVTPACLERGYRLGERLHIALYGHTPGT
jgi:7-carboxy-7-deazaguanine synthase